MIFLIPIFVILAGVAILLQRRYSPQKTQEAARVVVKGHTYSEVIQAKATCVIESKNKVDDVRRCCIIGAGRVGIITAIVLASKNPDVHFCVVDANERLIAAWKSDRPPIVQPGLEDLLFDDACLAIEETEKESSSTDLVQLKDQPEVGRRRKLGNLHFSSDIGNAVAEAQMVFLCLEMDSLDPSLAYLDPTLELIASASKNPKILVQRSTSPYGTVQYIKTKLTSLSPTTPHTILTNPAFTLPSTALCETLTPSRVIIGHVYSPDSRPDDLDALKRLYRAFVPAERIVTMDAFSTELGRMGSNAVLAQQVASLGSIHALSGGCEASSGAVGWMLGVQGEGAGEDGLGIGSVGMAGMKEARREVRCLVEMARELGMSEVEVYWMGVLRMQEFMVRRAVGGFIAQMETGAEGQKVAVLGVAEDVEMGAIVVKELRGAGLLVDVVCDDSMQEKMVNEFGEGVAVPKTMGEACAGCSGIIALNAIGIQAPAWQRLAGAMKERKVLTLGGGLDRVKMKQLGFDLL
ncbi:hypothetical protein BJX64DRAFT_148325 [Aspergillus heterothallicus]